jgi:hypothetical protein
MSEIKFACPHCSQHIACDGDYADAPIECPACGEPMIVPRLTAHPSGSLPLVVASTPPPARPWKAQIPNYWTEAQWERHEREHSGPTQLSPVAMAFTFAPIVLALVLAPFIPRSLVHFYPTFWITVGVICSLVAAWCIAAQMSEHGGFRGLIAVPLAFGILLMQLAFMTVAGCCAGAANL